jgi:hypothetical protein
VNESRPSLFGSGSAGRGGWRRFVGTVAVYDRAIARNWQMRVALAYAALTTLSYVAAMLILRGSPSELVATVAVGALRTLSWVAGGAAALALARRVARSDEEHGLETLLRTHGVLPALAWSARTTAVALRLFVAVGIPALVLGLVALWLAPSALRWQRLWLALGMVGYAAVLATLVSLVMALSSALSRRRVVLIMIAVLLVPQVVRASWPGAPSIPALLERLLRGLVQLATVAT